MIQWFGPGTSPFMINFRPVSFFSDLSIFLGFSLFIFSSCCFIWLSLSWALTSISCSPFSYFAAFHVSFSIQCLSLASVSEIFSCIIISVQHSNRLPDYPLFSPALFRIPNSYPVKLQFAVFSVGQAS